MKKLSNLLAALAFVSLVIFISCGKDDGGGGPNLLEQRAAELQKTWTLSSVSNGTSNTADGDWSNFTLAFLNASSSGGTYQVTNVPTGLEAVWPTNNTSWSFNDNDPDEILRAADNVVIEISIISDTSLRLVFTITTQTARTSAVNGEWTFNFTAAN